MDPPMGTVQRDAAPGYAAVLGDVVGSRGAGEELFARLDEAFGRVDQHVPGLQPLQVTIGDEFQGLYPRLGPALNATLLLRLYLHPVTEVRVGVGWGMLTRWNAERAPYEQDGPAWWSAREALEAVEGYDRGSGMPAGWRTAVRLAEAPSTSAPVRTDDELPPAPGEGLAPPRRLGLHVSSTLEGLLLLRDQVLSGFDERDVELLVALLEGENVTQAGERVGISQQAASRRLRSNGGYALLRSWELLDDGSG